MSLRSKRLDKLRDEGEIAAKNGQPCEAPTKRELERAAWEIGYRAAKKQMKEQHAGN